MTPLISVNLYWQHVPSTLCPLWFSAEHLVLVTRERIGFVSSRWRQSVLPRLLPCLILILRPPLVPLHWHFQNDARIPETRIFFHASFYNFSCASMKPTRWPRRRFLSVSLRLCSQEYINRHIDACNPCRRTNSWFAASARGMPHMLNFPLLELMIQYLSRSTRLLNL
ncbi:hypothetical protein CI102_12417 [Trichoderma harzianum]|nr:hypothetical protein CI102_12417 [Trichoderma harzianum]